MKLIDRLPYHAERTYLNVGADLLEVRPYQIIVWVSLKDLSFPQSWIPGTRTISRSRSGT